MRFFFPERMGADRALLGKDHGPANTMKALHIDAFAGISGDMTVAALRDLGVPAEIFTKALATLPVTLPECRFERALRGGIAGWRFRVAGHDTYEGASPGHTHDHGHEHHHPHPHSHSHGDHDHHGHQHGEDHAHGLSHAEIRDLISRSSLQPRVRERVLSVFQRIAEAEGAIHGVSPDDVGFHEVGAVDSIADIVAACAGLEYLGVDSVTCGHLQEGTGHIHCAHGTFPLPAPATLALLRGIPLRQVEESWEHITPTGAAILAEYARKFGAMPEMSVSQIGYGLGSRETPGRPNVLRLILGEPVTEDMGTYEEISELRTNLDDLTPEQASEAMQRLLDEGALDVTLTPSVFKKGRSGWILEVLCRPSEEEPFVERMLRYTSAFGVRRHRMQRQILDRTFRTAETPYGPITVKIGSLRGEILQQSPEYSSCSEAAARHGVPVRQVYQAALASITDQV